ncbi:hypothetical protein D3C84_1017550 [compost metagenome]
MGARLYFGGDAEHAGMLEAIGVFEVVEGFVEHEIRFALNPGQTFLQTQIQRIQTFIESLEVALVAGRIGRIDSTEVGSHFRRDYASIDRR